jgi:histidinol-phosphatase (PHP family)
MNNYHTHTFRCRHASGDVADYVREAKKAGLKELGFSDHVPFPDGRWSESRMNIDELPSYLNAIKLARKTEGLFAEGPINEFSTSDAPERIRILSGLECEWVPEYDAWLREELRGRLGFEYLVCGTHYSLRNGAWEDVWDLDSAAGLRAYATHVERSLASGLFAFIAHPDLFCASYLDWDVDAIACARDVLSAAVATRTPIEINGYGMRKPRVPGPSGPRWPYPRWEFWELARDYDLDVIVNSDAHRAKDVGACLETGCSLAADCGLRVVDTLQLEQVLIDC